ncbi:MAG: hypothetical protein K2H43_00690, partial [Clostridia bacterium]|nr:hypothetical protein [Clostridia bacterium]
MKLISKIKERVKQNKYGKRFLERYEFKTAVMAVLSLAVNVAFAVMNGVSGVLYSSIWFGALAAYYVALILFRGGVIFSDAKSRIRHADDEAGYRRAQTKIYLGSGAFLVIVGIAMCVAVTQTVLSKRPTQSGEIMAIATAAYAFFKITMAIINLVRAKSHGNPVVQSLRNINFSNACMSMVSLTVLLIETFDDGTETPSKMLAMKALAGFAACALTLGMATFMIVQACKKLK